MFDKKVIECFLNNQLKLFPEKVAENEAEAREFLEDNFAVVVKNKKELIEYFEEEGVDYSKDEIENADEVFAIGDGRFLIVEA
ncbi:MAG: glyoxalase [Lachnospiraceae bacterium]|nr:glyoxalase [Lachnospiraceae bacterium]